MADFTANMTSVGELDNSIFTEMDASFLIASNSIGTVDQFCTIKREIGAKAIEFPKYALMADATTPLTDKADVASVALSDSQILLTPAEYGNVITTTRLVTAQSGGKADVAAARLAGLNMQSTLNKLAINVLEAGANKIFPGTVASEAELVAGSVMSVTFLNRLYNKLSRAGVAPLVGDMYVAIMSPDQVHDLRISTGAGSWQDINKYAKPEEVLKGEIGALAGFRVVVDSQVSINADAGASAVDSYHCLAMGENALGKAVSKNPELILTPGGDKLNRFTNVGWYGILNYGLVDTDALWVGTTSSSVGNNAA